MKTVHKTVIATATAFALTAGMAQANPWNYGINNIDYRNSFNTSASRSVDVNNSKKMNTDYRLNVKQDNSRRTSIDRDFKQNYRYDYRKDSINANQSMNQVRKYNSGVGQNAANVGGAKGHSMKQAQGGTSIGSLVSESNTSKHKGHSLLSPTYSSNYGSTSKGNLYGSQIGGTQSGLQMGNVINAQNNQQKQAATSSVGSRDRVSNSATK